jgi:hypothetical protein
MTPDEKLAAERLADDLAKLLAGGTTMPWLLDAPMLNWWRAKRCTGWPPAAPKPFYLVGVFSSRPPKDGDIFTLQATGAVCWMAHDLTWCRCADCWYRLGEADGPAGVES